MDKDIVLKKLLWKFWQIDEIELNVNAHDNERENIISLLTNGVIVK